MTCSVDIVRAGPTNRFQRPSCRAGLWSTESAVKPEIYFGPGLVYIPRRSCCGRAGCAAYVTSRPRLFCCMAQMFRVPKFWDDGARENNLFCICHIGVHGEPFGSYFGSVCTPIGVHRGSFGSHLRPIQHPSGGRGAHSEADVYYKRADGTIVKMGQKVQVTNLGS